MSETLALVPVGNEILSGKTLDTNSNWIAAKLGAHGVVLKEIRVVPDQKDRIIEALNDLKKRYDYIITTGGIGPTHDDITAESVAQALDRKFIWHPEAYDSLLKYYGEDNLNEGRLKMAMMPEGARLIPNAVSGAPGFSVDNIFVLAGIPEVMKSMMGHVLTYITPGRPFVSKVIKCPFPESRIAGKLGEIQQRFQNIDIGSYPGHTNGGYPENNGYLVNVIIRGTDEASIEEAAKAIEQMFEI